MVGRKFPVGFEGVEDATDFGIGEFYVDFFLWVVYVLSEGARAFGSIPAILFNQASIKAIILGRKVK